MKCKNSKKGKEKGGEVRNSSEGLLSVQGWKK